MLPRPQGLDSDVMKSDQTRRSRTGAAPDRAFAFLSKTFIDAQRGTELDLKLLSSRSRNLASSLPSAPSRFDLDRIKFPVPGVVPGSSQKEVSAGELLKRLKEQSRLALELSPKQRALEQLEKLKLPLTLKGGKLVSPGELVKQLQDSGRRALSTKAPAPLAFEELFDVKNLQGLPNFQGLYGLQNLQNLQNFQTRLPPALEGWSKLVPDSLPALVKPVRGTDGKSTDSTAKAHSNIPLPFPFLPSAPENNANGRSQGPAGQQKAEKDWEDLMFEKLNDFSRSWEQQLRNGAGSLTRGPQLLRPFEGRQLVSLTDWNTAVQECRRRVPLLKTVQGQRELAAAEHRKLQQGTEVAFLAVQELLEGLAKSSEELLCGLGLKTEVMEKQGQVSSPASGEASGVSSLDMRLSAIMDSTGYRHKDDGVNHLGKLVQRCQLALTSAPPPQLPLEGKKRSVTIVTTASLPWMTGTSVNPLLRAAYLAQRGMHQVTLVVPWLTKEDQELVYPQNTTFDSPAQQEAYVRDWLHQRVGFQPNFKIVFYPGKFSRSLRSIFAVGDITSVLPEDESDVAVLEEPEHLNWFHHGRRWNDKFRHVVGIVHTNYLEYAKREEFGKIKAFITGHVSTMVVRSYSKHVIRLSGATQNYPRSSVCNVHGVGSKFLRIGDTMVRELEAGGRPFSKGAYYLGKMVWSKGYRELVNLLDANYDSLGSQLKVDVFGSGEDAEAVRAEAEAKRLRMQFHKGRDHADPSLHNYKVFINPSVSDVLCTTTAEALAMGKLVVCADHPSNDFFRGFSNCLMYRDPKEFVEVVKQAMATEPKPLTPQQRHLLTWEAATDRFLEVAGLQSPADSRTQGPVSSLQPERESEFDAKIAGRTPPPSAAAGAASSAAAAAAAASVSGSAAPLGARLSMHRSSSLGSLMDEAAVALKPLNRGVREGASPASLTMSLSAPDLTKLMNDCLSFAHFMGTGFEPLRLALGGMPNTMHVDEKLSKDLGLLPPWVERPSYGW